MTVTVIVLDSVGLGALPDADAFGDANAHTLDHTVEASGVSLPNLAAMGLGNVPGVDTVPAAASPSGAFGRMIERSPGKDTTTGHWEFMGVILDRPFRTFTSFPPAVMSAFDAATGRGHLANRPASGTTILDELGEEHLRTGRPIVYTSADSVFQVAAHVDVVPLDTLYAWCEAAREILMGDHAVARVIARPFRGEPGAFERLHGKRRDLSLDPPRTVLNALQEAGKAVIGVGKIGDIYSGSGVDEVRKTADNEEGVEATLRAMGERPDGLVFANLVEFDAVYGHRRDVQGYGAALAAFDARLPELVAATSEGDVLMLVSDHGNDPTWHGTDHTREYGLLLAHGPAAAGRDLGTRQGFSDLGATVAELLNVAWDGPGTSFATRLRNADD
ncbi:MAG: phosphopentomutase [Trueperaceae bacterium]|nr:phosphopentomutase [Trueperaceae bacterium]